MSYYILPKKHNTIDINPKLIENIEGNDESILKPVVSHSLIHYLNIVTEQIKDYFDNIVVDTNNTVNYDMICKIINPYEFIFSKVPGLKYSVSKLKPQNNIFFIIMEIMYNFNIFDYMNKNINTIHLGKNSHSIIECMNIMREDYNDNHIFFELNQEGRVLSIGYNGLSPKHLTHKDFWENREERRKFVIHAETNALSLIRKGEGESICLTISPCFACAKDIVSHEIQRVFYIKEYDQCNKFKEIFDFYKIHYQELKEENLSKIKSHLQSWI